MTPLPARRSRVWAAVFRVSYRFLRLLDPLIRSWIANSAPGLDGIVELRTVGRRTGRPRRTLATMLSVDGRFYVGHPNGMAEWLANMLSAGWVEVEPPGAAGPRYTVDRLPPGAERDGVIRATWTQQPFPANLLYRVARRHVVAAGEYVRLVPGGSDGPVPTAAAVP